MSHTDEEWARNLVGRDWEIFWDSGVDQTQENGSSNTNKNAISSSKDQFTENTELNIASRQEYASATKAIDDLFHGKDDIESEEEPEPSDWYDGLILSAKKCIDGNFLFFIKFCGDEEVYDMVLTRELVRPSARAWIRRTRALLLPKEKFDLWEQSLPADTMTLEDVPQILQLKGSLDIPSNSLQNVFGMDGTFEVHGAVPRPLTQDLIEVQFLLFQLRAQMHFRTKLAPIIDHGDRGEDDPTEAYVNHLVASLEQLDKMCTWYSKCFNLHQMFASGAKLQSINVDNMQQSCIEDGGVQLIDLVNMDVTHHGAKRKTTPAPSGARKTKRRRTIKEPGPGILLGTIGRSDINDDDHFSLVNEGHVIDDKWIQKVTTKVINDDSRWFQQHFAIMLRSTSFYIQEPITKWKRQAESVLGGQKPLLEVQSETGTSVEMDSKQECNSISSMSEEDEAEERFYSFEDVESCYTFFLNHPVLRKCNLSSLVARVKEKLSAIQNFETHAWTLISCLAQEPASSAHKANDEILLGLKRLKDAAELSDPFVLNIDPLGSTRSSKMNRDVLRDAIAVREWVLDLRHSENCRERVSFVQGVVSRAPSLPHIPSPPNLSDGDDSVPKRLAKVMADVQKVSSNLYSYLHVFTTFERLVAESSISVADPESLRSIEGVSRACGELRAIPVLSMVEEKLAVRLDIMNWKSLADRQLSFSGPYEYTKIEELHGSLVKILAGENRTRSDLLTNLELSNSVDKEIRGFAASDTMLLAQSAVSQVEKLYMDSWEWKKRAESIILALKVHGNSLAGSPISSTKATAMVDLKRIDDLLAEYPMLNVQLPEEHATILRVRKEAKEWSWRVSDMINGDNNLYECLVSEREHRPKGLMMEPTRHVVDSWIEALDWYNRVSASLTTFMGGDLDLTPVYQLILEGMEIVVSYSLRRDSCSSTAFVVKSNHSNKLISNMMGSHRQLRHLSKEKIESTELGKKVFSRLIGDENNDYSLCCLVFLLWRIELLDLLEISNCTVTDEARDRPTLLQAQALLCTRPQLAVGSAEQTLFVQFVEKASTSELERFTTLMNDAENVKVIATTLLARTKELIRGTFKHADEMRQHFSHLKEIQAEFKSRSQTGPGLVLNVELEQQLDLCIKDLSWLVRTLPYPVLHIDDADLQNLTKTEILPWETLVSLFEKIPSSADDGSPTDIARVALRVRELQDSASGWQEEVTQLLSLSIRGVKRRVPSASPCKLTPSNEPENHDQIDLSKLAELARNPILKLVAMPREPAVREVLENVRAFEIELHNLLGEDFALSDADKAPYPDSDSLVGDNGDFHLYRLTGSPLFEELLRATKRIDSVASEICADTSGKAAFEWIKRAVHWVYSLNELVADESSVGSSTTLSIPAKDAQQALVHGNTLFLDGISDGVRKTLSSHRIFISTNKQTNKLTVVIGKGGAHHSMGGTCLKWCPLLHEWLKEDFQRLLEWESRFALHANNFTTMQSDSQLDDDGVYQLYRLQEETERLLDEGVNSLVVTPEKSIMNECCSINEEICRQIESYVKSSNGRINKEILRRYRYDDGELAVEEREDLLVDLLNRRRMHPRRKGPAMGIVEDATFRDKARSILEKALTKSVKMMGIYQMNAKDVSLLCSLKASELESAIFAENKNSQADYRDKVISLRSNMEDVKNSTLATRYLLRKLSAEGLVLMSPEELASQHIRKLKAKAETESKRNITIAPTTLNTSLHGTSTVKNILKAAMRSFSQSLPGSASKQPGTPPQDKAASISHDVLAVQMTSQATAAMGMDMDSLISSDGGTFDATGTQSTFSPPSATPSPTIFSSRLRKLSSMPPPPPSLGFSITPGAPNVSHNGKGTMVSTSGSDQFTFCISRNTFRANLVYEGMSSSDFCDGFLPDSFSAEGRLSITEFQKFVGQKIDGGRWTVVTLRLSITSESDAYKAFYKEYEAKKRIVMFAIGQETKVFLVTPRFHRDVLSLVDAFTIKTSTYAIVLTREQFFE